ncbi:MAG: MipA/OmpV family protein [Pseudomonadota bacterium]|nr:MipA/OmpV family protein [Pseudomonadota bacterium]
MRRAAICCGVVLALGLLAPFARAQSETASTGAELASEAAGPLWELGLGAAAVRLPDYRGSDQGRTYLLPLPYVVYRGKWLRADRDGARALLLESGRVKVDVSVAASVPTRSRDNVARSNMPDLAPSLEIGPNLNVGLLESADRRMRLDLRLPLRAAVAVQRSPKTIGATFSPNLNVDIERVAGGWNVGLLGGPLFADRRYHDYYYGVDSAYATPQRSAYRARGGYGGWQALAAASRRYGRMWVGGFVRYDNLHGAVFEASPLVRRDHEVAVGVGVSWVFATSDRLVSATE